MPNLRHMADLVAGELHHVDVVGPRALAGGSAWTAGAGMGAREDTVGGVDGSKAIKLRLSKCCLLYPR